MSEQQKLMRQIHAVQFSIWELHIFLDTHPNDSAAYKKLEENLALAKKLTVQYEDAYGSMGEKSTCTTRWSWIQEPWPWEIKKGDED